MGVAEQEEQRWDQLQQQAREQAQQRTQQAQDCRLLLSSLERVQFFSNIERECFNRADQLPLSDTAGRDRAYFILHMARKFKKAMEACIVDGELAEQQLTELLGSNEQKKRGFLGGLFNG